MRRPGQIRRRLRSEDGIALPVAMLATVIGLGFAAVVIASSVSAQRGDTRDHASEQALTAAESGANLAIQRQVAEPCEPEGDGWCEEQVGTVGDSDFSYWVKPGEGAEPMIVVAEGSTVAGAVTATRRVAIRAEVSSSPSSIGSADIYANGLIVGIDWLNMHDDARVYNGGAGSNDWVWMEGSANVCGTVSHGGDFATDNSTSERPPPTWWPCSEGRTEVQREASYPPVALPEDLASNNSNWRLSGADPTNAENRGNLSWNPSNKHLNLKWGWIRLEGTAPYMLCRLHLEGGGILQAGPGNEVKIFFLPPDQCPGLNGDEQLVINNGAHVDPDAGSGPGFYLAGSSDPNASLVKLEGGATSQQFIVYAPNSAIRYNNGSRHNGAIIGRTLDMGGADVNRDLDYTPPPAEEFTEPEEEVDGGASSLTRESFVECVAARPSPGSDPDAGC